MHFNVFSSGVKHGVAREVYAAHIIVEDADRIHDGTAAPLYSASVLDSATVGFFLLLQEIAPQPRENTNPDVDRRSAL